MNREFYQLMLTSRLGDGHLRPEGRAVFSCIKEDYVAFKKEIIEEVFPKREIRLLANSGYKNNSEIYSVTTLVSDIGKKIYAMPIEEVINELDEFGMAIWAYDDGSLHHKNLFYNLNTHAIPEEIQRDVLLPKLKEFGMFGATIFKERKKDGREFAYINIPKLKGAYELDCIMRAINVESYKNKLLPDDYKAAYEYFKTIFSGKKMSQRTLSKLISERLAGEDKVFRKLNEINGFIYASSKPNLLPSENYTIVL